MVIYDNDKENIYKSMVILRNKNNVLSALTGSNLQALTEATNEWTVNFSINSENILITFNTNGDSAKIRILFNQYSVETN